MLSVLCFIHLLPFLNSPLVVGAGGVTTTELDVVATAELELEDDVAVAEAEIWDAVDPELDAPLTQYASPSIRFPQVELRAGFKD